MVYHFYRDFAKARRILPKALKRPWRVAAITSTLSPPVLKKLVDLCHTCDGLKVDAPHRQRRLRRHHPRHRPPHRQRHRQGHQAQPPLRPVPPPGNCLRKYDERFLDDLTLSDLRAQTGKCITPVLGGSLDFVETILEQATGFACTTPPPITPSSRNTGRTARVVLKSDVEIDAEREWLEALLENAGIAVLF